MERRAARADSLGAGVHPEGGVAGEHEKFAGGRRVVRAPAGGGGKKQGDGGVGGGAWHAVRNIACDGSGRFVVVYRRRVATIAVSSSAEHPPRHAQHSHPFPRRSRPAALVKEKATAVAQQPATPAAATTPANPASQRAPATPDTLAKTFADDSQIVRALYVNRWASQSPKRMRELIAIADSTEINAFVIDMKDEFGLNFESSGHDGEAQRRQCGDDAAPPGAARHAARAPHSADRAARDVQGFGGGAQQSAARDPQAGRHAVARQEGADVGGSVRSRDLGVQHPRGRGDGEDGIRRGAVRLHPLSRAVQEPARSRCSRTRTA